MEKTIQTGTLRTTLGELAKQLGGTLEGPADFFIERLTSAETGDPAGLAFAEKEKYVAAAKATGVGALLIGPEIDPAGIPAIRVPNPKAAFFMLLVKTDRPYPLNGGIHPTAVVSPEATVGEGVNIGPYVVVEAGSVIGDGCRLHAHVYVGEGCELKESVTLLPHAVLVRNVEIGARSTVFSGAVLGADGFGFVWDGKRQMKVPQVGRVILGPDCEIGALSAVDRATAGATKLGADTKLDNLVQLGHNCIVGEHVVIAALTGVGGSTTIGDRCSIGGTTAISDHAVIGSDIMLGGRAGVAGELLEPGVYIGYPAQPMVTAKRNIIHSLNLDKLNSRVRQLERKLAQLEAEQK